MQLLRMNPSHRSDVFLNFFICICSEILISKRTSLYSFLQQLLEQEILHYCCLQMGRHVVLSDAARHGFMQDNHVRLRLYTDATIETLQATLALQQPSFLEDQSFHLAYLQC